VDLKVCFINSKLRVSPPNSQNSGDGDDDDDDDDPVCDCMRLHSKASVAASTSALVPAPVMVTTNVCFFSFPLSLRAMR